MPLKYTTTDNVKLRLRGRLNISNTLSPMTPPPTMNQQTVDPALIESVGSQIEDELDLILSQIYVLPLANQHPIITGIVEHWVISELMTVYYQGSQVPELNGDAGFGALMYKKAMQSLQRLIVGHNIYIDGLVPPQNMPGAITPQPILLPNETLVTSAPDTITRNTTVIGVNNLRKNSNEYEEWGITWKEGTKRARGADQIWN